jgi:hypothetical protein
MGLRHRLRADANVAPIKPLPNSSRRHREFRSTTKLVGLHQLCDFYNHRNGANAARIIGKARPL